MQNNPKLMVFPFIALFFLCLNLCPLVSGVSPTNGDDVAGTQTYIIQLRRPHNFTIQRPDELENWYRSFLPEAPGGSSRMVYQYSEAMLGFAARLTEGEVREMEKKEGFLKAYPDTMLSLFTTHTPSFLGLQEGNGFWKGSNFGKGVIIGIIDSGVVPDHPSFNDEGMPPPPPRWKGACMFKKPGCNNKVIGARSFAPGGSADQPPIDEMGHGTHTASTAAGNFVTNAAVLGNGNGTAAGMAPRAHLAIYRACGTYGCTSSAVIASMDAAIKDGVDILSLSLGGPTHLYNMDVIAIGAFSAMEKGILVSCAAGNDGPDPRSLSNEAPWILTVGASTMDRSIRVTVKLGDGRELDGESLYQPDNYTSEMLPLVHPNKRSALFITNCDPGSLNKVAGKIVVCYRSRNGARVGIGSDVKRAGGAAMILVNGETDGYTTLAEAHVLPASHISYDDGRKIMYYIQSSGKPAASLVFKGTIIGNASAPAVASFSSRGPSIPSPHILKPDIIGPGVSVLAGWPFPIGSVPLGGKTAPSFNIISGTSMATPHLSGIAALVKSMHPDWSPAAIKSAIMTTSGVECHDGKLITDEQRKPASHFMMGAGHVNPEKASDPGLVYDLSAADYVGFLCGLGYDSNEVEAITRHDEVNCSNIKKIKEWDLNYPAITVSLGSGEITVNRTVTHVCEKSAKYSIEVESPEGVEVSVVPGTLEFSETNEKKSFAVTLKRIHAGKNTVEGQLKWVSDKHVVRSPIVVTK